MEGLRALDKNTMAAQRISARLLEYLRDVTKTPGMDYLTGLEQLHGGYETATFSFQLVGAPPAFSDPLVLRLYPKAYGSQNAAWESTIQNVLFESGYPTARAHWVCTDQSILGGAFFIMDYFAGQPLMFADPELVPELLGQTHAELHLLDPQPLIQAFAKLNINAYSYSLKARLDWLQSKADQHHWLAAGCQWLQENRPFEPEKLSVCHGDFHPLNILIKDGKVTGVLDWGGFSIADPVFDIANTIVLTTIPAKILSSSWDGMPDVDWDLAAERYLMEYRKHRKVDRTNLAYYIVRRCLFGLVQGVEGQTTWQHPTIVSDLLETILRITDLRIHITN